MTAPTLFKFEEYLRQHNLKMTNQRQLVAQTFFSREEHISAEELYIAVQKEIPQIGFTTVYRTLSLLVEAGLASCHNFRDSFARFEPSTPKKHHDHLFCSKCGNIIEFRNNKIEKIQKEIAQQHQFNMKDHALVIFGTCAACCDK